MDIDGEVYQVGNSHHSPKKLFNKNYDRIFRKGGKSMFEYECGCAVDDDRVSECPVHAKAIKAVKDAPAPKAAPKAKAAPKKK